MLIVYAHHCIRLGWNQFNSVLHTASMYISPYTDSAINLNGLKGNLTNAYFDLAYPNNFAWVDTSELPLVKQ